MPRDRQRVQDKQAKQRAKRARKWERIKSDPERLARYRERTRRTDAARRELRRASRSPKEPRSRKSPEERAAVVRAGTRRRWERLKADPEKYARYLEAQREWSRRNPGRRAALARAWLDRKIAETPEEIKAQRRALKRNREALKRGNGGRHTAADIAALFELQGGCCAWCGDRLKRQGASKFHVDHIRPLALGGSNARANLCLACPSCNITKGAKPPEVFARSLGLLL